MAEKKDDTKSRKKLLVIAQSFPPYHSVSVIRITYFVKYLSQFDWDITVLKSTLREGSPVDDDLLQEIPEKVKVIGIRPWKIPFLERKSNWVPSAIFWGLRNLAKEGFDVILATGRPFSSFVTAAILSLIGQVPYVLDYRDPWTCPYPKIFTVKGKIGIKFYRMVEKITIHNSSYIIVTTDKLKLCLLNGLSIDDNKLFIINNGHNLERIDNNTYVRNNSAKINLVYTGTVDRLTATDEFILALERFRCCRPDLYKKLSIIFIGKIDSQDLQILNKYITHINSVPYYECLLRQKKSDILLSFDKGYYCINMKLYEYIAAKRPVLNICCHNGAKYNLFNDIKGMVTVHYRDIYGIIKALVELIEAVIEGKEEVPEDETIMKFSRKKGAEKLDKLLNYILEREC